MARDVNDRVGRCHFCDRRIFLTMLARVIVEAEPGLPLPVDLCGVCAGSWLSRFVHGLSPPDQSRWLSTLPCALAEDAL